MTNRVREGHPVAIFKCFPASDFSELSCVGVSLQSHQLPALPTSRLDF